jgi:hypothetical protein
MGVSAMKTGFLWCISLMVVFHSIHGQDRYGLTLGSKVLQSGDTISLSYPSGSAIVVCKLIDGRNNILGNAPAEWSVSGTITIVDTPLTAPQVPIDASRALKDQRGYLTATALESGATWICNKVYLKIKGKNSRVLRDRMIAEINRQHRYGIFDVAGRRLGDWWGTRFYPVSTQTSTIMILRDDGSDQGECAVYFRR